ncbi:CDP-alcohol phosphatidyltransferase family protein [Arthrobacter sp. S39]|uniref:CDP-alcohol phosphatidyltransferase family protein n=1 Tax=Arthrobacter sp. S39 TaxID=2509720 RepID=UPI00103792BB|nr:CDP-alcohol phosphatidyltransferase family protein [Arthrobacter sp. S39]TAP44408.1 CDP-alcohol phosphatidyltransferase family protein [Arthrobacter sp. S39]
MSGQHAKVAAAAQTVPYAGYRDAVSRLSGAQKTAARGAPAYSRFVNRRLGRYLAAAAFGLGLTPNAVTAVSAVFTFTGIGLLVAFPPSWGLGIAVSLLLVVGYALDSADGQLARLTGTGSPAGEWLDHMVDSVKTSVLPLALLVALYRFEAVDQGWLLVPLGSAVVATVLFFSMILTEQLRRQRGVVSMADDSAGPSWLRSLLVVPMDYGVLCLSFLFYGAIPLFMAVYTAIFAATAAFLALASVKWFRELQTIYGPASTTLPARNRAPSGVATLSDSGG